MTENAPHFILASTSSYRRDLLKRLGISFSCVKPLIDEEKEKDPNLGPRELAEHLAYLKAKSLKDLPVHKGDFVLGGDQLVWCDGRILGKPGTRPNAVEQLRFMSGKTHELITAIMLFTPSGAQIPYTDITRITFKNLSHQQIDRIVDLDQPMDCAGAYKMEAHGIALVEKIESEDFNAIQGLPLIALSRMLNSCGLNHPQ